jgi:nucleotide-binding universal stress UspA family protein
MASLSDRTEIPALNTILIAYDGGAHGRRALHIGAQLAHALGARVDVVSVVAEGFDRIPNVLEQPAVQHARVLIEAKDILRERGVKAGLIEPAGNPAETIEQLAVDRATTSSSSGEVDQPKPERLGPRA